MNSGEKPRLTSVPFQVASRLPMSKTIVPFAVPMAYAATGVRDTRCGRPILFSDAQRSSEVHVVTDTAEPGQGRGTGWNDRGAGN